MAESYTNKDILALGLVVARLVERLDEVSAERDAQIAVLVQEYADVLARRGQWGLTSSQNVQVARALEDGARSALLHVAERLGVTNMHDRAQGRLDHKGRGDARQH